jgi:hypothetical protein
LGIRQRKNKLGARQSRDTGNIGHKTERKNKIGARQSRDTGILGHKTEKKKN